MEATKVWRGERMKRESVCVCVRWRLKSKMEGCKSNFMKSVCRVLGSFLSKNSDMHINATCYIAQGCIVIKAFSIKCDDKKHSHATRYTLPGFGSCCIWTNVPSSLSCQLTCLRLLITFDGWTGDHVEHAFHRTDGGRPTAYNTIYKKAKLSLNIKHIKNSELGWGSI